MYVIAIITIYDDGYYVHHHTYRFYYYHHHYYHYHWYHMGQVWVKSLGTLVVVQLFVSVR